MGLIKTKYTEYSYSRIIYVLNFTFRDPLYRNLNQSETSGPF